MTFFHRAALTLFASLFATPLVTVSARLSGSKIESGMGFEPLMTASNEQDRRQMDTVPTDVAPRKYIIEFNDNVTDVNKMLARVLRGAARKYPGMVPPKLFVPYETAFKGASLFMTNETMEILEQDPNIVSLTECLNASTFARDVIPTKVQSDPLWFLDRLDQAQLPLDSNYSYTYDGSGVEVYVLDTGMRVTHEEIAGRAFCGFDLYANLTTDPHTTNCTDDDGHGTFVATVIGGKNVGVAKNVTLVAVKTAKPDTYSDTCDVIAGIDFVARRKKQKRAQPMVLNMSLGLPKSKAMDKAVNATLALGVTITTSAGNDINDSCDQSPSNVPGIITVAGTNQTDGAIWWSGYGPCVDFYAPGLDISGGWKRNDTHYKYGLPGTSFSSAMAAGIAAMHLQKFPRNPPSEVIKCMQDDAIEGVVTGVPEGTVNRFLQIPQFKPRPRGSPQV